MSAMLAQILPGIRHVRTPLVTGTLWLLTLWLWVGREWPTEEEAIGLWADLYKLAGSLGQPVVLAALGVTAYLVGARVQWLVERLQDRIRKLARMLPWHWRRFASTERLSPQVEVALNEVAERLPSGEGDDKEELRGRFRASLDLAVAEAKFRWPAEAPDLFQEYDRRESERDFSNGVALPLAALSAALLYTHAGWTWMILGLVAMALLSKIIAYHQHRELERFVLEAVMVGRVKSQLTDLLRSFEDTGRRLVAPSPDKEDSGP